jgi:uncharacterized protein YbjQ (UPF0145 family)
MTEQEFQAANLAGIAAGGLPLNAIERLKCQALRQCTPNHNFTSNLSANELLLTRQCGFEPLGQVMGGSVYHLGWRKRPGLAWLPPNGELDIVTQAYNNARHLAISRLQQEAKLLGATGVLGVRLTESTTDLKRGLIKIVTIGAAVRDRSISTVPPNALPFVSGLSGQEHFSLFKSGYRPVGFAMGNSSWFRLASQRTRWADGGGSSPLHASWRNQELVDYTEAFYKVREQAVARMLNEATACSASGIIGVKLDYSHSRTKQYEGLILHFSAMGTCISQQASAPTSITVSPTVSLNS